MKTLIIVMGLLFSFSSIACQNNGPSIEMKNTGLKEFGDLQRRFEKSSDSDNDFGGVDVGVESTYGNTPYMDAIVRLDFYDEDNKKLSHCTATLVHKRFLLTAWHCFKRTNIEKFVARFGQNPDQSEIQITLNKSSIVYKQYENRNRYPEFALIKLPSAASDSKGQEIEPLPLLPTNKYGVGIASQYSVVGFHGNKGKNVEKSEKSSDGNGGRVMTTQTSKRLESMELDEEEEEEGFDQPVFQKAEHVRGWNLNAGASGSPVVHTVEGKHYVGGVATQGFKGSQMEYTSGWVVNEKLNQEIAKLKKEDQ